MTSIQVADETFVAAAPDSAAVVTDPARWRRWWPDLRLRVTEHRGTQGVRWQVGGPLEGTMEIWCEAVLDGFVLHYFLHADPPSASRPSTRSGSHRLAEENRRRRVAGKAMSFEVKDILENGRLAGEPAVPASVGA